MLRVAPSDQPRARLLLPIVRLPLWLLLSLALLSALLEMLEDPERWQGFAREGLVRVRKLYSWDTHAHSYMEKLGGLQRLQSSLPRTPPHRAPRRYRDRAIFSDLDQTLLGNPSELERFVDVVREHRRVTLLGIATGRRLDSALSTLRRYRIPVPDVLITSLGTEIHYSQAMTADDWWDEHIDHLWKPHRVRRLLSDLPGLIPQAGREQSRFKISYHYDPAKAPSVEEIGALLHQHELTVNVIHAFGQFLDVLPSRASKGLALRYVVQRWRIPLERVLVAGGSGADEDMMRGNTRAVVVANRHHEELQGLRNTEGIYFAEQPFAAGIIEAIEHYDFFAEAGTEHDA